MTSTPPPTPTGWRKHARSGFDRLPTKWLITGIAAILLAISALLGGLNDSPVAAVPVVEVGAAHAGSELTITVERALLIDGFPEQYIIPDSGNRLLVVTATVENTTNEPRRLSTTEADAIALSDTPGVVDGAPPFAIAVVDDGSQEVVVQPGVPVTLAFMWQVPTEAVSAGDVAHIDLLDRVVVGQGKLTFGPLYGDPVTAATLTLTLGDVGAGANTDG
ncbi:hypothetical protein [Glaciihabitans sp. dw_435]|uniref:hypothetical protein n=1 Tax=Glaciihabitans sp. dw_435 TaxID=2720081 RepID=UPI001BD586F1|nr:hypothetical protein [Glaciihabitans sp. dw_435]